MHPQGGEKKNQRFFHDHLGKQIPECWQKCKATFPLGPLYQDHFYWLFHNFFKTSSQDASYGRAGWGWVVLTMKRDKSKPWEIRRETAGDYFALLQEFAWHYGVGKTKAWLKIHKPQLKVQSTLWTKQSLFHTVGGIFEVWIHFSRDVQGATGMISNNLKRMFNLTNTCRALTMLWCCDWGKKYTWSSS